jgi:hypothetical protein
LIAGYGANNFSWDSYLSFTNTKAAPPELFSAPARANTGAALHGWKVDNIAAAFRIFHIFTLYLSLGKFLLLYLVYKSGTFLVSCLSSKIKVNV